MAGKLVVNEVQLGDHATPGNNFVWRTNVDGTAKLARGIIGATTQDIIVVDAAGNVRMPISQPGSAPVFGVRAWCTFNGTTGAMFAGGNVTSVSRTGVGSYIVNFTVAMPHANYAPSVLTENSSVYEGAGYATLTPSGRTTGRCQFFTTDAWQQGVRAAVPIDFNFVTFTLVC